MRFYVACFVLILAITGSTACFTQDPKITKYKWSFDFLVTCEYNGITFMAGSHWIDAENCQKCSCTNFGLSCCGIGFYAGPMVFKGCAVVADHCKVAVLNKAKTALCSKIHET